MNTRFSIFAVLGVVAGCIGVFAWRATNPSVAPVAVATPSSPAKPVPAAPPPSPAKPVAAVIPPSPAETPQSPRDSIATNPPATVPAPAASAPITLSLRPQREALADLDKIQVMFRDFRSRLGGNPVGTNAEIMRSVMGRNPFQARLGPPEGQQLNEQGELLDRWGSAYFFHQLSAQEMEIRSAGPDRRMYTPDDVVAK